MIFTRPFLLLLANEQVIHDLVHTSEKQEKVESIESIYLSYVEKKSSLKLPVNLHSSNL